MSPAEDLARRLYQRLIAPGGVSAARREIGALRRAVGVVEAALKTNRSTEQVIAEVAVALVLNEEEERSMEIQVTRSEGSEKSTIGELAIDGQFYCYTLEDVVRPPGVKVYGATAIPAGRYRVTITMSQHFGRELPLLCSVPNFEGVRIHSGNTARDTEGCILVGSSKAKDFVGDSRKAFEPLFERIQAAIARGEAVWITIG